MGFQAKRGIVVHAVELSAVAAIIVGAATFALRLIRRRRASRRASERES